MSADCGTYAVVPPERLGNKKIYQLQELLKRCGDFGKTPASKTECVERILAAGYDMDKERAFMEKQKQADDERSAQLAIQRAEHAAYMEKKRKEDAAKAKAKEAEKADRLRRRRRPTVSRALRPAASPSTSSSTTRSRPRSFSTECAARRCRAWCKDARNVGNRIARGLGSSR